MSKADRAVAYWLASVCVVVFCMIVIGGVTRLTHSGLSMVDWKPILGAIPPIGEDAWQGAFDAYKQYPEYQKVNKGMELSEFKFIYYWEYGHRLLGRIIGLIFFVPLLVLISLKMISRKLVPKLFVAFILGGLQGLLGWYMVKSGLVDMPRVSHFRLAAHLLLAMFLLAYLFWFLLDICQVEKESVSNQIRRWLVIVTVLFGVQVTYGAFVAGLRAGLGFNTFPLMNGSFMAEAATMMSPVWLNFTENGAMVQFIHRWVAVLLFFASIAGFITAKNNSPRLFAGWLVLLVVLAAQFSLGVATLLFYVPISLASIHQAVAVVVMLVIVYLLYISKPIR